MNKPLSATNINCYAANDITELPENTVMISVNNVDEPLHPLKLDRKDPRILTVVFPDITKPLDLRNRLGNGKIFYPLSDVDALKILTFIETHKTKNFIVHCSAGISRSGGICLFLNRVYRHELKPNFWHLSHPNPHVLNRLLVLSGNEPEKMILTT